MIGIIYTVSRSLHSKALSAIEMTPSGMLTDVRPLQPENAYAPIDVTLLPMVTEVRLLQFWHTKLGICLTLLPKMMFVRLVDGKILFSKFKKCPAEMQLSALNMSDVRLLHPMKAASPIVVTPLPMVTEARLVQL